MLSNQKSALIQIHKKLVKQGYLMLAQAVLQHLAGLNKNQADINYLLTLFNFSALI